MNEIRVNRMLLGGGATFLMWIALEFLLEGVGGRLVLGNLAEERWLEVGQLRDWDNLNATVSAGLALLNSTVLIWLYASLRPMYGVGYKTALITSGFLVVFGWSLVVNAINLGVLPTQAAVIEGIFETIEAPLAILVGAAVYEGGETEPEDEPLSV
jgi:hypothetical protein